MRKSKKLLTENQISILTLDDDPIITSTIKSYFNRSGYDVDVENDPIAAIERVRNSSYDILLLDFLMAPICGDKVVEEIRKFNKDIYIILLTGHKSMAPPIKTLRDLDIQGYFEKNEKFDQLELLVESCVKSILQMRVIRKYQQNLSKGYMQTIGMLTNIVETRDKDTKGHSERVSALAKAIAEELGMSEEEVEKIRIAGLFHDIGKIGVPDTILLKNGSLTKDEFVQIKKHPGEGEQILREYSPFKDLLPIIKQHHERFDGTGYPDGKAGEEICIGARIMAVADSFDAMISNRAYRKGLGFEKTMSELENGKNTQFDPNAVEALNRLIDKLGRVAFEQLYCSNDCSEEK